MKGKTIKLGTYDKNRRIPMSKEELRIHNEQIVGSARIFRNRKKYYRPSDKKGE